MYTRTMIRNIIVVDIGCYLMVMVIFVIKRLRFYGFV